MEDPEAQDVVEKKLDELKDHNKQNPLGDELIPEKCT